MKRILLLLGVALLFCKCNKDEPGPFFVYDVETDYRIDLRENLSETKKELLLEISTTIVNFSCDNAEIITQSSIIGEEIIIDIEEIRLPPNCVSNNGGDPARTFLNLGELGMGNYQLTFSIGNALFNYGTLAVTDTVYEMIFEEELNGIEIPRTQLMKIPNGTIWGRLNGMDSSVIKESLDDALETFGASPKSLISGNYTNFEIDADDNWHWHGESTSSHFDLAYAYSGENISQLGNIIDSIHANYGDTHTFELNIFTYTGLEY